MSFVQLFLLQLFPLLSFYLYHISLGNHSSPSISLHSYLILFLPISIISKYLVRCTTWHSEHDTHSQPYALCVYTHYLLSPTAHTGLFPFGISVCAICTYFTYVICSSWKSPYLQAVIYSLPNLFRPVFQSPYNLLLTITNSLCQYLWVA